jgi:hypothetical protein
MLIDQLGSIARMAGGADQQVGRSTFEYFEELRRELRDIQSELTPSVGTAAVGRN